MRRETWRKLFLAAAMLFLIGGGHLSTVLTAQNCTTAKRPLDFDGDGKTDFNVVRNTGGGANGAITWFNNNSAGNSATPWGITSDRFIPADYDGDGKADFAVWRPGTQAFFYILQSQNNAFRADAFGQTGDDPSVTGDYTGDGKADPAIYRSGANSGNPSFWSYRSSSGTTNGQVIIVQWGQNGDFPTPGDFDGDGRYDFGVQRSISGAGVFFFNQTTAGFSTVTFGSPTDRVVPGYYDGDCKTDIAIVRGVGSVNQWYVRNSTNGAAQFFSLGAVATDFPAQGDYDGDGITDVAVWRSSTTAGLSGFYWRSSISGAVSFFKWGQSGDYSVANFNTH